MTKRVREERKIADILAKPAAPPLQNGEQFTALLTSYEVPEDGNFVRLTLASSNRELTMALFPDGPRSITNFAEGIAEQAETVFPTVVDALEHAKKNHFQVTFIRITASDGRIFNSYFFSPSRAQEALHQQALQNKAVEVINEEEVF